MSDYFSVAAEKTNDVCSICLGAFDFPVMVDCKRHYFCLKCIARHLRKASKCPQCSFPILFLYIGEYRLVKSDNDDDAIF